MIHTFAKHVGSQDSQSRIPISGFLLSRLHSITSHPCSSSAVKEQLISAAQFDATSHSNDPQLTIKVRFSPLPSCCTDTSYTHYNFSNLPTDPSLYRLYESALVVKFYNYRIPINVKSTYGTLQTAIEDVIDHLWGDVHKGNIVMTPRAQGYSYRSGQVGLTLYTQHDMTWGMWGETLQGLREFGEFWEFVELQFDIIDGQVMRGSGQFRAL